MCDMNDILSRIQAHTRLSPKLKAMERPEQQEEQVEKPEQQQEVEEEELGQRVKGVKKEDEDDYDEDGARQKKQKKSCVPGILYLGHIPPRLRPKHLRNLLSPYGEIGRVFLQPEDHVVKKKKKKVGSRGRSFTEGWVEFREKRVAKRVAATLNNTPMGSKKHHRFHSDLWCIKYLHRFHWTHLNERLAYEQTVLRQRLRTEVSQAKKETNFYLANVDKSHKLDRLRKTGQQEDRTWSFTQRQTEEEIQKKKMKISVSQKDLDKARLIQQKSQSNVSLLAKIFNSGKTNS